MKNIILGICALALAGCSGVTTPDKALQTFQSLLGGQQPNLEQRLDKAVDEAKAIYEAAEDMEEMFKE